MISRKLLNVQVMAAIFLSPAALVAWGIARLLDAMGDQAGARVVDYVAITVGSLWAIDLVLLVLSLGIRNLPVESTRNDEIE